MEIWAHGDSSTYPGMVKSSLARMSSYLVIHVDSYVYVQASYFVSQGFRRRDGRSNMLLVYDFLHSQLDCDNTAP